MQRLSLFRLTSDFFKLPWKHSLAISISFLILLFATSGFAQQEFPPLLDGIKSPDEIKARIEHMCAERDRLVENKQRLETQKRQRGRWMLRLENMQNSKNVSWRKRLFDQLPGGKSDVVIARLINQELIVRAISMLSDRFYNWSDARFRNIGERIAKLNERIDRNIALFSRSIGTQHPLLSDKWTNRLAAGESMPLNNEGWGRLQADAIIADSSGGADQPETELQVKSRGAISTNWLRYHRSLMSQMVAKISGGENRLTEFRTDARQKIDLALNYKLRTAKFEPNEFIYFVTFKTAQTDVDEIPVTFNFSEGKILDDPIISGDLTFDSDGEPLKGQWFLELKDGKARSLMVSIPELDLLARKAGLAPAEKIQLFIFEPSTTGPVDRNKNKSPLGKSSRRFDF